MSEGSIFFPASAHDLYAVDRSSGIDAEDERLNLSTLFGHGEDNIVNGGEERNNENIATHTVATNLGEYYADLIAGGVDADTAKTRTVERYHEQLKIAYEHTFGEDLPQATSDDLDEGSNKMNAALALRTLHGFIPGEIEFNGQKVSIFDPILSGESLSQQELQQLSKPLDGAYDPVLTNMPAGPATINLFELDSSFGAQFNTDFALEDLLSELEDGTYDENDTALQLIRADFSEGQDF